MTRRDPRSDAQRGPSTKVRCEATDISEGTLDESLFKIPTDYTKDAAR